MNAAENNIKDRSWEKIIMKYNQPDNRKSIWQICNSFIPYVGIWVLMYFSLSLPYWTTLLLAILAAGFMIRLFIIFHDCGHGSFFRSKKINDIVGNIIGVLVFTPYSPWHYSHKLHHSTAGNLAKRGQGDVWTMTVEEYKNAPKGERTYYNLYRNPWIMFTIGALLMMFVKNRFTSKKMSKSDKQNVYFTNIMLVAIVAVMSLLIGFTNYLIIQLPIVLISHSAGIWLFYVQHQFDDVYWDDGLKWDYKSAAMEGSSFLKLPIVLQWFTGNIGFHHIHHLSPRIPNYNLARCHYENELFREIRPLTIKSSIKTLKLRLWDDISGRMISFRQLSSAMKPVAAR
jgi:acyl-lipid omega-6 desaturase (Delta-12 desaturase)